jgi:hypothetical protein
LLWLLTQSPGRVTAPGFFVVNEHAVFARGKAMQFQEGYGGKAVGADRSALRRLEAKDKVVDARQRGFPVFSLFSSVISGRARGFPRVFADFSICPPPCTGIYRLGLRHDN